MNNLKLEAIKATVAEQLPVDRDPRVVFLLRVIEARDKRISLAKIVIKEILNSDMAQREEDEGRISEDLNRLRDVLQVLELSS